jgi:hypothetical protein
MLHCSASVRYVVLFALVGWVAAPAPAGPPRPATPEDLKTLIASAKESKDYDNADVVYVLDEADVYVQPSGLATTESCQVLKMLTDAGARGRAVFRYEFDPATNRVTLQAVKIHRKGGPVEDVPIDGLQLQPAPQHAIYWGNQQYVLDLRRLEVGDCLEIRISKTGYNIAYLGDAPGAAAGAGGETLQPPMPGHWHESTLFQGDYPIIKKRYSVHMPKDKPVQYEVYNGELKASLWFDNDALVYTFVVENMPKLKTEPHGVSADDSAVKVVMATVPDWGMKSRWFWEANKNQFDADEVVRAKVAELTAGLTDDAARMAALNHWVADNVRYYGTSRGPCEGFTLHKGTETIRDLGGVCKDKAGMLVTMLRAAGIDAYPALTMAGSRVEDIPADQFNHTVTTVRNKDGTFTILDPTWIPASREMWSSREALQALVYGTPQGETLTLSPYYPPEYNQLTAKATSTIGADGTLATQIVMDMQGYPCTYLRRSVERTPLPERRAAFEKALNIAPTAKIEDVSYTDPRDYSRDSHVDLKVSAPAYVAGAERVRLFHLPLMSHPLADWLLPDCLYALDTDKRDFGLRMRATRLIRYEETVKLPPGWKVERVPEKKTLDSGSAALTFEATPGDGTVTYRFELTIKNHIVPPADYPDFKKALDAMKDITKDWVVCTVGEG